MLSIIATYFRGRILRYFTRDVFARSVTMIMFLFVIGVLSVIIHVGFYVGFGFIAKDQFFGQALSLYIIELFLLISTVLVFASAIVSGVVSLFRGKDGAVLMASPHYDIKPWIVFIRMFVTSLWPLLVVIVPALVAIQRVFSLSALGFLLSFIASVFLVLIAVVFAMLVLFLTSSVLFSLRIFSKRHLLFANIIVFLSMLSVIWSRFHSIDLAEFFQARILSRITPDISPILDQFTIFPSHLVSLVIYHSEQDAFASAVSPFVALIFITIILIILFYFSTKRYLQYWQVAQEGVGASMTVPKRTHGESLIARAKSPQSALLVKEYLLFVRNPRGMLWLGFILFIWGVQSASSFLLVRGLGTERVLDSAIPLIAGAFQFALVSYFMSMFALRFAFPSFSEEFKTRWISGSAPLSIPHVFRAKLLFFSIIFTLFALIFTTLNVSIIGFNPQITPMLYALIVIGVVTITVYALSLGAIFPNSETDDPEILSTTLPGLSFIVIALLYGAFGALIFRWFTLDRDPSYVTVFMFISVVASYFLARKARATLIHEYSQ